MEHNPRLARILQLKRLLEVNRLYQEQLQATLQKVEEALAHNEELSEKARKHRTGTTKKTSRKHQRTRLLTGEKIPGCPYFMDQHERVC